VFAFVVFRVADIARRDLPLVLDRYFALFVIETVLFLTPLVMLVRRPDLGQLFRAAMVLMFAGALYRFDTFLVAYDPGPGWHYFPAVPELLITFGLVALELAVYVAMVKRFPILQGGSA
jgi:Ni/Fe-hydrogenase subunit HybB-like protein